MTDPTLFDGPRCVIPGCTETVDEPGDTCPVCVEQFGSWLRPAAEKLTADQIHERDAYVARAYHAQKAMTRRPDYSTTTRRRRP